MEKVKGIKFCFLFRMIRVKGIILIGKLKQTPVNKNNVWYIMLRLMFSFDTVCPANWQPNSPTIKPDPEGSKEYFDKVN